MRVSRTHHAPTHHPFATTISYLQSSLEQYVQPEYNVHPLLRKPDDAGYKPYKRKAPSSPPPSSSSSADDDIRPNLALYQQQRKPEPYVSKRIVPSRGLSFLFNFPVAG